MNIEKVFKLKLKGKLQILDLTNTSKKDISE